MKNAMRKSSRPYIGPVPSHWRDVQLKHVLRAPITDGPHETPNFVDEGFPFLSVDGIQDGRLVFEGCRFVSKSAFDEYRRKAAPEVGDLLMGKAASTGKIARLTTNIEFAIWSPLALIKLKASDIDSRFAEYVLKTPALQQQIDDLCNANTQKNIGMGDIPKLAFALPPICEQQAIANFLDEQTARIDALIAEKERLVSALVDVRESEICRSLVPNLFDANASHLAKEGWLNSLPSNWEVKSLRRVLLGGLSNGVFKKRDEFGSGALLVNVSDLYAEDFRVDPSKLERVTVSAEEYSRFQVQEGDLFFVRSSLKEAGVAVSAVAGVVSEPTVYECHVVRARPDRTKIDPRFLSFWLNSTICRQALRCRANTTTMTTIDQDGILSVEVPLPPLDEQRNIVRAVERIFATSQELTSVARSMQERLREYRASLISAAVTGQLDINSYKEAA